MGRHGFHFRGPSRVDGSPPIEQAPLKPDPARLGWQSNQPIIVGKPTPAFEPKEVAAKYRTSQYRPDSVLDGWSNRYYTVRGASVRGYLHRYNGAPRQDDFALALRSDGQQLIVAVADGVSGATQSHIAASTVVRYACQWLDAKLPENLHDTDWTAFVQSCAWALIEQGASILGHKSPDPTEVEKILATTLTCAVLEPDGRGSTTAHIVGVGDSAVWILSEGAFMPVTGGKADGEGGITSSAVSGLPRVPETVEPVRTTIYPGEVLLVGTDGIGDPLGGGEGDVGRMFAHVLHRPPSLLEFVHAVDFSRETFDDDRTLVAVGPLAYKHEPSSHRDA
ncbi:protein phosphatase 2C domain-containing protein [Skermania sp. ID1734]|uniref:protein phosphatase 2C domain-containing protein n=1 Tax=Skermania sp. ID1734 TaxID=2597516 RepID=UPI00117C6896|nr:protein phosphatase 2C domain-containing protein [Skermania sp. ID1734]TSD93422.1 protein phosphatase 2C domain-containing protein [Skermania sp. ID1734]